VLGQTSRPIRVALLSVALALDLVAAFLWLMDASGTFLRNGVAAIA